MSRIIEHAELGMWQANCYVLGDLDQQTAVVVDPGQDGAPWVRERLAEHGLVCEAILCTHGHIDHIWSVPELARELDVPVLLHPEDMWLWQNPVAAFGDLPLAALEAQFGLRWEPPDNVLADLSDHQRLAFAGYTMTVRHTPGHTPGSCVFLIDTSDGADLLVSGDLLFAGSVGRTDFPRGSHETQQDSLRRVVLPLADDVLVLPGHGPRTTIGRERRANPFLAELG